MYYKDLTYVRSGVPGDKEVHVYPHLINIGWLGKGQKYKKGDVPAHLIQKIRELLFLPNMHIEQQRVGKYDWTKAVLAFGGRNRGLSYKCPLCQPEQNITVKPEKLKFYKGDLTMELGNGDFTIPSLREGEMYRYPSMLYHYITRHGYYPPVQFLEALDSFDLNKPYEPWNEKFDGDDNHIYDIIMPWDDVNDYVYTDSLVL